MRGILDVRCHAYSHKFGFSGSPLKKYAKALQLRYWHIPVLGVEPALCRHLQERPDYDRLFFIYERGLQEKQVFVERALNLLTQQPVVLLCFEADPALCHRSRLAAWLAKQCPLPIQHL
ncbi:DUF488 domain-containing protein [Chthonomonas calidirosea]|uniref:DUF488 domain-containing protein n=1 Tax=Chthonomonas calidirosea TaxID=454171 RepID=UPI0009E9A588|nr:DUF488 domain-containing protein [Chthonomonas calidirosea]